MVIDTSAIIAILRAEPEAALFLRTISEATIRRMSAARLIEAGMVATREPTGVASRALADFVRDAGIAIAPVTESQAWRAIEAFRRFGKGTGHPAGLNFGDCFSYALAAETGEPLLFKGGDFAATDLVSAC